MRILFLVLAGLSLAACSGSTGPRDAGSTASGGSSGGDAGLPPGTTEYSVSVNGLPVQAGTQVVYCTYVHLGNPQPINVIGFTSTQALGGHHVIVVANKTDQPDKAPWICDQGEAINPQNGSMIYVSQIDNDSQLFPPGVGMNLPANASLMVQIHYIDATPNDLTINSTINVLAGGPNSVTIQAAPLLFYDESLTVPQGTSSSTSQCIMPQGPEMNFFMMAGHMHSHGTDFTLQFQDLDGGTFPLYQTSYWDSPPEKWFAPALKVQAGTTFTWTCDYDNIDGGTIDSPDEMCATLGIYYPAPGGSLSCFYVGPDTGTGGACPCIYGNQDGGLGL
ncbi:MAG TPA: hypothetical protein VMB50_21665 [Myxococcales bacterium]|nr:hypothetical protein [Myxococcales bacterium]